MHQRLVRLALAFATCLPVMAWAVPATLRVDIQHGGDIKTEHYALERVMVEALPWAGNPARPLDDSNRGANDRSQKTGKNL